MVLFVEIIFFQLKPKTQCIGQKKVGFFPTFGKLSCGSEFTSHASISTFGPHVSPSEVALKSQTLCMDWEYSRALHRVPMPMPTHTHGFWVGMGVILLFMGGHRSPMMGMVWVWVQIRRKMLGSGIQHST